MDIKDSPSEVWNNFVTVLLTGMAGSFGACLRQWSFPIHHKSTGHMVLEWLCGAIFSIYGADLVAHILYHLLTKYDMIALGEIMPQNLVSFSGFLCGMVGVSFVKLVFYYLKRFFDKKTQELL